MPRAVLYGLRAVLRQFGLRPEDSPVCCIFLRLPLQSFVVIWSTGVGTGFQLIMEFAVSLFGCELERNIGLILFCTHYQRFFSVHFDNTLTDVSMSVLVLRNLGIILFILLLFPNILMVLFPLSSAKAIVSCIIQYNTFKQIDFWFGPNITCILKSASCVYHVSWRL